MNATDTHRQLRVFIVPIFRDRMQERDELMSHAWSALRRFIKNYLVTLP